MEHLPAPSAYLTTIQHRFLILLSAACVSFHRTPIIAGRRLKKARKSLKRR
jgi:hypothetical protein